MSLRKLRERIDRIDDRILELLNQRVKNVLKIISLKEKKKLGIFSAEREASILKRLKKLNQGPLSDADIDSIFNEIFSICRYLRSKIVIAYLGPQGTFTHLAAIKKFGKKAEYIDADSIKDVFDKVEKGESDYGVVPIENSIEGVINYTLDMFLESDLKICSEILMDIKHCLLVGENNKTIRRIYSNQQVFAQCRGWLMKRYPKVELVPTTSTAKAAEIVKQDRLGACIGSRMLASLYGLRIIASGIEDMAQNITRFLVISAQDSLPSGDDKTSILFSVKDRVGALHDALSFFKRYKINLTKIESRPSKKKLWEYYFFADFEGHYQDVNVRKALDDLEKICVFVKVLGSYPKA